MRISGRSGIRALSWGVWAARTRTSTRRRSGRVRLREAAENAVAEFALDPRTAVVHADADVRAALFERDIHLAPLGRELRGIGEQVGHHLKQPLAVDVHFAPGPLAARLEAHLEALAEALVEHDRLA